MYFLTIFLMMTLINVVPLVGECCAPSLVRWVLTRLAKWNQAGHFPTTTVATSFSHVYDVFVRCWKVDLTIRALFRTKILGFWQQFAFAFTNYYGFRLHFLYCVHKFSDLYSQKRASLTHQSLVPGFLRTTTCGCHICCQQREIVFLCFLHLFTFFGVGF